MSVTEASPVWRSVGVFAVLLGVSACAGLHTGPLGGALARLQSATVRNAYSTAPSSADVRILRGAGTVRASVGTVLNPGDTIITSADARVVLEFAVGYEVVMDTGTTLFIESPASTSVGLAGHGAALAVRRQSGFTLRPLQNRGALARFSTAAALSPPTAGNVITIFLRLGQAFVRRLTGRSDTLNTRTPQALLQAHGTEYLVSANSAATVIRVAEDAVDVTPRTGNFPRVTYTKFAGGIIANGAPARRMAPVTPDGLEEQLAWVRQYDRITRITVPQLDSMTESEARAALARVGLKVFLVTHASTGRSAPERVVEYTPGAGLKVAPGTFINLVLEKPLPPRGSGTSDGGRASTCTVPNLVEQRASAAIELLKGARLRGQPSGDTRIGDYVSGQQEAAGSQIACNSVIHYTLVYRGR